LDARFNWLVVLMLSRCRSGPFEAESMEDLH
jgi:hypothetical protein